MKKLPWMQLLLAVVFATVIQQWQWNEPGLAWKSIRHVLDVWERLPAPCTQASGPEAPRQTAPLIQNHCQTRKREKQTHREGCWHTLPKLWPFATCDSFLWKMPMWLIRRACESLLTAPEMFGLAECGCESYFILIYLSVDEYTHTLLANLQRTLCHSEVQPG